MKKVLFLCMCVIALASCSSLDQKSQVGIKGNWTISSVTYPGSDYIKVTSFDVADSQCFVGSSWKFVSNNNTGEMTLNKVGCPAFSSPIIWSVTKDGSFTLKITEGEKGKRVTQGYYLKVMNQSESSFQLVDNVNVGGKNVDVVYQFNKM
ncbi:hypothetical protein FUA48_07885 [Flavobacterium alkalisoli]|uniref:Lipocalin-like domain-containing protein n=1 Tax=Flavobacterium alkalisoli TaxID=2602769 RepID=A0A5B9FRB2_9FLAO|nr:lipocalin family protein [Flavobacterium alkalisoli]QEE49504.1 hypothetical protein FUA48_07885 [Flavobacterium alkalisoli]